MKRKDLYPETRISLDVFLVITIRLGFFESSDIKAGPARKLALRLLALAEVRGFSDRRELLRIVEIGGRNTDADLDRMHQLAQHAVAAIGTEPFLREVALNSVESQTQTIH